MLLIDIWLAAEIEGSKLRRRQAPFNTAERSVRDGEGTSKEGAVGESEGPEIRILLA